MTLIIFLLFVSVCILYSKHSGKQPLKNRKKVSRLIIALCGAKFLSVFEWPFYTDFTVSLLHGALGGFLVCLLVFQCSVFSYFFRILVQFHTTDHQRQARTHLANPKTSDIQTDSSRNCKKVR